jgi:hypothetical protein
MRMAAAVDEVEVEQSRAAAAALPSDQFEE